MVQLLFNVNLVLAGAVALVGTIMLVGMITCQVNNLKSNQL